MNVYLETSALLSWVLEEPDGTRVETALVQAKSWSTSQLTQAECLRAFRRLGIQPDQLPQRRFQAVQSRWNLLPVHANLIRQAGQAFPVEPVRTLDAIHLVSALDLRSALPDLQMISLDYRVRDNATALGFPVLPSSG
ncbi:type II toxin-antitoxin system VapC family toxin [bacterium]|nr:type II toxin-antitoxin system VapC family toxin [bacterium]